MGLMLEISRRFHEKWIPNKRTGCWIWTASRSRHGYGAFRGPGTSKAHRTAWILAHGRIPGGLHVLHRCDTRSCVNPAHLFLGTNADNVMDKVSKGRQAKGASLVSALRIAVGERHGKRKLTELKVREIRALASAGVTRRALAKRFGVNHSSINEIVARRTWSHVL